MVTKLHILFQKTVCLTAVLLLMVIVPCAAQFNPKKQAVPLETVPDTLIKSAKPTTELKFSLYSDAYDKYLRKLRTKQRNTISFKPSLQITQVSFTNWQQGGDNSYSGLAALYFEHNYTAPVFSIKTVFDSQYGLMRASKQTRKNVDYFNLTITPSWNISQRWKLSTSMIWKSQFSKSYDYPANAPKVWKSSFMAPGTVEISGGLTYEPPSKKINILLAPIAGKMTFVLDDSLARKGGFGIDPTKENPHFKAEIGMQFRVNFSTKFAKEKIEYVTKLESFWNYELPPSATWNNTVNFKFTDVISASLIVNMIYNDQITTPKAQEKRDQGRVPKPWDYLQVYQSVGLGLKFNIASKPHKPIEESTITRSRLKYKQ
ncbi:MAG TPA: DUF3078 domain-containing protein [Candidatus Rikenella faecigallinarum]|uniref:DUF3078 domain-containing protein n=1 Tax=Candidatus Rikenella faecigallinarum TaxID=2838745 RepID=A0A9D1QEH0_9BACT|nr:DUF3078 domain-containing protein [Candidatus Rikenella faecigallinarum]